MFDLDATGSITFTNKGNQLCFVLVLDVTGHKGRNPIEPTLWDFTQPLSDADVATMNGSSSWTLTEDEKTWNYKSTGLDGSLGLDLTDGLLFAHKADDEVKTFVSITIGKDLRLPSNSTSITIPQTAKGDVVRIRFASNSPEEERGFTVRNGDVDEISTIEKNDFIINVARDVATSITNNASVKIYQIAVNQELPAETEGAATAISEVQTEMVESAAYNLAGQRVSEGYKGVVVKNGKKVMVK